MSKLIAAPFKVVWWLFVIVTPILAVWLASSLAVFLDGPIWAAVTAGALLFPVLPVAWDFWASRRFARKQEERPEEDQRERYLTFGNRLTLRTLVVNMTFMAVLIGIFPEEAFTALSTRGDWPLDHIESSEEVESARSLMFKSAESLEVVHNWARENPYADENEDVLPEASDFGDVAVAETKVSTKVTDEEEPADTVTEVAVGEETEETQTEGAEAMEEAVDPDPKSASWPMKNELHPLVASMPKEHETSPSAVARYIVANEENPFLRVKALHDYVADRIAYDLSTSGIDQDAASVFERRTAVCEGYARMLVEMGREAPEQIVYVPGVSRGIEGDVGGGGHAWNAVQIEGKWYLVDPTWNAGFYTGGAFEKKYRTDYLFTPPEIFVVDHFPDNDRWQLLEEPISRGEFMRRPMMRTGFYREGLALISPTRSQVDVGERAVLEISNPRRRKVVGRVVGPNGSEVSSCDNLPGRTNERLECSIPSPGKYSVQLFAGNPRERTFPFVGQIKVIR